MGNSVRFTSYFVTFALLFKTILNSMAGEEKPDQNKDIQEVTESE
jgi:hypothetical protein